MGFLGFLGGPLGIVMSWIYTFVGDYFLTIFIFTFLVRLLLFPISLKQQKSAMDRAKIAPALERLQKKYGNDRQKLMEKQQALYEKHGVSMTGGCLPMLLSMIVLFGVIAAIYSPLTNMTTPALKNEAIAVAQTAVIGEGENKFSDQDMQGYYGQLRLINYAEFNEEDIVKQLNNPSAWALQRAFTNLEIIKDGKVNEAVYNDTKAMFLKDYRSGMNGEEIYQVIAGMKEKFYFFGTSVSMLDQPWTEKGFGGINWLWLIPIISGLTSFAVSYISMQYNKRSMPQNQPGQGCTNNMMLIYMPAISLFIAFTVPGAVGLYWIFSNLISMLQTVIVNKIYDPAKARAEAEAAYQERRRKKAEDKKRLAQARQREEAEARKAEQALERQREESREMNKKKKKKGNSGQASVKAEEDSISAQETEENGDVTVETDAQ